MARRSHGRGISVIVVFWDTTALQGRVRQNVFPEAIHPHAVIFPGLSFKRCLTLLHLAVPSHALHAGRVSRILPDGI